LALQWRVLQDRIIILGLGLDHEAEVLGFSNDGHSRRWQQCVISNMKYFRILSPSKNSTPLALPSALRPMAQFHAKRPVAHGSSIGLLVSTFSHTWWDMTHMKFQEIMSHTGTMPLQSLDQRLQICQNSSFELTCRNITFIFSRW